MDATRKRKIFGLKKERQGHTLVSVYPAFTNLLQPGFTSLHPSGVSLP